MVGRHRKIFTHGAPRPGGIILRGTFLLHFYVVIFSVFFHTGFFRIFYDCGIFLFIFLQILTEIPLDSRI